MELSRGRLLADVHVHIHAHACGHDYAHAHAPRMPRSCIDMRSPVVIGVFRTISHHHGMADSGPSPTIMAWHSAGIWGGVVEPTSLLSPISTRTRTHMARACPERHDACTRMHAMPARTRAHAPDARCPMHDGQWTVTHVEGHPGDHHGAPVSAPNFVIS